MMYLAMLRLMMQTLFQNIIIKIKPFEKSYSFLLSNDGTFVAHPNLELMGKLISDVYPYLNE